MAVDILPITDRATWLEWRKADLTASDIAAAIGQDPHRSALQVYGEKAGLITAAMETNIMRRGRWFEAAILEALKEELPGYDIRRAGIYVRDPELRLGATPDFLACDPEEPDILINIQGKVVNKTTFERQWADEQIPLHYQLQTLAEGMLLDAGVNLVAALVVDTFSAELVVREVPRHKGAEDRIRQIAIDFWKNIAAGRRPAPDYKRDEEVIAEIYAQAEKDSVIDLSGDNRLAEILPVRAMLKDEINGMLAQVKEIDAEIKDKVGINERAIAGDWKLSWKEEHRQAYQVKEWTGRVLRVNPAKEKAA